jgi:diadenosine tetraphosphate (Ap4A) HIT family hydrolase
MNSAPPIESQCPFCRSNGLLKGEVLGESSGAYLIRNYLSPSNYLIIPQEHIESPLLLPDSWWSDVKTLLRTVPQLSEHYNISMNFGSHAGQTVKHLHFWVMPRRAGLPSSDKGLDMLIQESDQQ